MLIGIDASRAVRSKRTGTESYSRHVIRHLLKWDTTNQYRLYMQQPPPTGLFDSCAELRIIKTPRLWTHLGLSTEMVHAAPDVLFVPAHVLPIVHPRRSVVTIHDLGYHYFPDAHTRTQRAYLEWSTRFAVKHASRLIAVSHATKRDLVNLCGANEQRIAVVHHGVDVQRPTSNVQRPSHQVPERYILSIGTLQPRKNYTRLVEAFASLQCNDVGLVIVGKVGWNAEEIVDQARRAGVI
ncbi:MAG: glycosyltransferase family 4 protein, partial [Chloroflexi bacterium]|nr:glycosyltransferase family 4 protein [Chloroflexota bacterium]